jgi:hypothetical protein
VIAEGKRAVHDVHYWPYVALLVAVIAMRWWGGKTRAVAR